MRIKDMELYIKIIDEIVDLDLPYPKKRKMADMIIGELKFEIEKNKRFGRRSRSHLSEYLKKKNEKA